MSGTNKTLNFYIYQMQEGSYNLYNALTDKEIYFDVDGDTVKSFLSLNEPTHPFVLEVEDNSVFEFTFDTTLPVPTDMSGLPEYESQWDTSMYTDNKIEYSLYDPFHNSDDSNYQMNFAFISEGEIDRDEEEVFEEELEFLPEDK
jgi:hypothetical protein